MNSLERELVEYMEQRAYLIQQCIKIGEPAENWVKSCAHSYLAHNEIIRSLRDTGNLLSKIEELQNSMDYICYRLSVLFPEGNE